MAEFFARHWRAFLFVAIAMDLAFAFGPARMISASYPIWEPAALAYLLSRWLLMAAIILLANKALKADLISNRVMAWCSTLAVWNLTLAAVINSVRWN